MGPMPKHDVFQLRPYFIFEYESGHGKLVRLFLAKTTFPVCPTFFNYLIQNVDSP
uniref:Uncharacterized protein n=1 Tax=Candidatus Kentrum sp. LPFa TaxID=2126335 RepID=A0A450WIX2_9GAMM|nr:MAG: hypothetical protein BECKLPF1236B_GA0070989_11077 [Candidatus Kentron sp. LPFa]